MAINTYPTLQTYGNAEVSPAFVVRYPHDGEVYVVGFDSLYDLTQTLVNESLDGRLVEQILDFVEESIEAESNGDGHVYAGCPATMLAFEAYRNEAQRDVWKSAFALALVTVGVLAVALAWRAAA